MSVLLPLNALSKEEQAKIYSDMTFHSNTTWRYVGGRRRAFPTKDPLCGCVVHGNYVKVPRLYAQNNFRHLIIENDEGLDVKFNFTGRLLDKQIRPVNECLEQLRRDGTSLMGFCTGFGKSVCMSYVAAELGGYTLFLVDGTVGNTQIPKTLKEMTDADIWVVGEKAPTSASIVVCMDTRIHKIPVEYLRKFTTVIIDEAHCWLTKLRYSILFMVEPKYLVLATSTPRDQCGLWPALGSFVGDNRVIRVFERPFNVYIFYTGIKVETVKEKSGNTSWTKLVRSLCDNEKRNDLILKTVHDNVNHGFKILILTWREDHADMLAKCIKGMGISASKFTGKTASYDDAWVITGTISKINKAFDEKAMCPNFAGMRINMVMLVGSTKSDILLEQMVGRSFRSEYPNIIHFVDDITIIKNHYRNVRKWYEDPRRKAVIHHIHNTADKSEDLTKACQPETSQEAMQLQIQRFKSSISSKQSDTHSVATTSTVSSSSTVGASTSSVGTSTVGTSAIGTDTFQFTLI